MRQSNLNRIEKRLNEASLLDEKLSYKPVETKYMLSVLKNRSVQATQIKEKQFEQIYQKARKTLKYNMNKLLLRK